MFTALLVQTNIFVCEIQVYNLAQCNVRNRNETIERSIGGSLPKFFHFHAVFGKNDPINRLVPQPKVLWDWYPHFGNPGSATATIYGVGNRVM